MREEKMVRQNKSDDKSNVSFNARQNNSVLVDASADFCYWCSVHRQCLRH